MSEKRTLKDRLDSWFGEKTIKEKLDDFTGVDETKAPELDIFEPYKLTAKKMMEKLSLGEDLTPDELMLLPADLVQDLRERDSAGIKINTPNYTPPKVIANQADRERAERRIVRTLNDNKKEYDRKETLSALSQLFIQLKRQERMDDDANLDDVEKATRRKIRKDNLTENRDRIIAEFQDRNMDVTKEVDAFIKDGSMDYEDAYLYFAGKSKYVENLDMGDFFIRDHPSRSFAESIPFYGNVLGIRKLAQLSDKIEALDAASPMDLQTPEYIEMIRDVALYFDAQAANKDVKYKVAESFALMFDFMLGRGVGNTAQRAGANVLFKMFPRMRKAFTTVNSKSFRDKLANATKKGTGALVGESVLAVNPAGTGLSTWRNVNEHRIRGQELIGLEVAEIQRGPDKGKMGIKYLNFGNPKKDADAWTSAVGTAVIQGLSERLGGAFDHFNFSKDQKGILGQVFRGALFKSLQKKNPDIPPSKLFSFLENANINGIVPEIMEERAGDITIGLLGVDQAGMEIKPGFQLFNNETKKWETEFSEIVIPTAEDFGVEVFTIATFGALTRQMPDSKGGSLPPIKMKKDGPVVKGSDPMVREFVDAGKTSTGNPRAVKVVDTIVARTNQILDKYGVKPIKYNRKGKVSPQFLKRAKERGRTTLVGDLVEWFSNPSNSELVEFASTWYGDRFEQTLNLLAENDFPELNNSDERAFFTFLVGVTSPSQAPEANLKNAINEFMIDKGFPADTKTSEAVTKQINTFKTIAAHKGGYRAAMDFLSQEMTGKELRDELFKMGIGDSKLDKNGKIQGSLGWATLDEKVYGAEMFGPKVGAFTLNLSGVDNIATIDLWMLREISMHLGIPFDNKSMSQINYSLKRAKDKGPTRTDWADNLNLARVDKVDNGQRKRIKIYRDIMVEVQQEFNKQTGENYSVADVQALVWYMSKSMFASYGTVGSDVSMSDYLTVAESLVNSNGVFNESTQRRIRTDEELRADERSEEVVSDDTATTSEEEFPEERVGFAKTDNKKSDGTGPSGSTDTENTEEAPKKRSNPLTKEVPQVPVLDSGKAGAFVDNLNQHKAKDETGYQIEVDGPAKYQRPYKINKGETTVTPTMVMSEDGKAGAALLLKQNKDGSSEVEVKSVFHGEGDITQSEVMRSAIRKAQRMGADKITMSVFDGDQVAEMELYGFVEVGRAKWDGRKAPKDWQFETHKKLFPDTGGKPDKILMEHDPKKAAADKDHPYSIKQGLEGSFYYNEPGLLGMITRYINDKLDPLKELKKQYEQNIRKLLPSEDFFNRARLSYNIAVGKFDSVVDWADSFIKRMAKDGITIDMLDEYMHAKHARERNLLVKTRNPDIEAGAGYNKKGELMTDEKADEILERYKGTVIDDYAGEFRRNVILRNIQVRLQGGLLTEDQARIYSGDAPIKESKEPGDNIAFANYVPLNLEMEDDGQVGGMFANMQGVSGFALNGPESRRIKGTESENRRASIFEMGMQNLFMGMTRAETNQVNLRLLNVLRNTDVFVNVNGEKKNLFEIEEIDRDLPKNYNKFGDPKYVFSSELKDNQILMKENGIEYVVTINSPSLVKSFRSMSKYGNGFVTQLMLSVNNFRKQFITAYNPEFFIGNTQSDLQTGLANLGIENGAKIAAKAMLNIPKAAGAIGAYNFNEPNKRPDTAGLRWYEEMIAYGGKISFFDFDGVKTKFERLSKRMQKLGPKAQSEGIVEGGLEMIRRGNEVLEGQMRLATYIAMREEGIDAETAAIAARDVTLDFNKSGELGPIMEAAYMFSKVGVNNLYRIGHTFKNNPGKSTALSTGMMLAGYMAAEAARAHDEEEWEKKSDWEKDHYFQFKNIFFNKAKDEPLFDKGTGSFTTGPGHIPVRMAYGWGLFAGLGVVISDWKHEQKKLLENEEAAMGYWTERIFDLFATNFSPASGLPTLPLQIAQDLVRNKDAIGRTIEPYKYDPTISDFENSFAETPEFLRDLSWIVSNAPFPGNPGLTPNGNIDKYGRLSYNDTSWDISPEELDYFMGQGLAGVYTMFRNTMNAIDDRSKPKTYDKIYRKAYDGLDPKQTPFIRKFYSYQPTKTLNESTATRLFFEGRKRQLNTFEVEAYDNAIRGLYKDGLIDLEEYNKRFTEAFENQTKQLGIPKRLRKDVLEDVTNTYGKINAPRGVKIKNRPKVIKAKEGLKSAIDTAKSRMEKRTDD